MIDKGKFIRQIEEIKEESENLKTKIIQVMTDWMVDSGITTFPISAYPYRDLTIHDGTLCVEGTDKGMEATHVDLTSLQTIYNELKEAIAKNL